MPVKFGREVERTIQIPKAWKQEAPSNNMRLLQVRVPKHGDIEDDAEFAIFKMKGGGGVDANIKRWCAQFGGDDALKRQSTVKTASGTEAAVAELEGTYTAMGMGGTQAPKADQKMLAAIIVMDEGEYYVKFTGSQKLVDENKAFFEHAVESFK